MVAASHDSNDFIDSDDELEVPTLENENEDDELFGETEFEEVDEDEEGVEYDDYDDEEE